MSQRQINAAAMRATKTSYKHLEPAEKRLVKAQEQIDQNNKDIRVLERSLIFHYGKRWRRMGQGDVDYDLYFKLNLDNISLSEKMSRLEDKYGLNGVEIMHRHIQINRMRCYGGSF